MKKYLLIIIFIFNIEVNASDKINYLDSLSIDGYDINFKKNIYEYDIVIDEEEYLNINYELSDDNAYVSILGNGNFNKSLNTIIINVNNDYEYKINVHKPLQVSYINEVEETYEFSVNQKNILKLIIIFISSIMICYFGYLMIKKNRIN